MGKTIIFIHGRSFKPPKASLKKLWRDAVRFGLERDHGQTALDAFDACRTEYIYYGDLSNEFLSEARDRPIPDSTASRKKTLEALKAYDKSDFYDKKVYRELPGASPFKEGLADSLGWGLSALGLSGPLIKKVAPDMKEYWDPDSLFGSDVRWRLTSPLKKAMERDDKILLIAHSLGSLVSFDTLWKFSYYGEYKAIRERKIDTWITLGSPLADNEVKKHLKGAGAKHDHRYPRNIKTWINIAAEDDYISHDQTVRNDYKSMRRYGLVESVEDRRIYNLSVRRGKSNPHSSAGYLIHPEVAALIAGWVQ